MKKLLLGSLITFSIIAARAPYTVTPEMKQRLSPHSLMHFAYSKYSQTGEEGVLQEIFKRLNITQGFFVEFGAYNGVALSNSRLLWEQGWSGAMIEADTKTFKKLEKNYTGKTGMMLLPIFVTWKAQDTRGMLFDDIKATYFPDQEIDFLSIDIDGADYFILKSLTTRPKVICIETGLLWHPLFDKEIPEKLSLKHCHQPVEVYIRKAREMGYEPVCMTNNLILVRRDLYEPFRDCPSDALTLYRDAFRTQRDRLNRVNRRKNPVVRLVEGPALEKQCPITVDF